MTRWTSLANDQDDAAAAVTIVGATKLPWDLDDAFRSRFRRIISVPLPSAYEIVEMITRLVDHIPSDEFGPLELLDFAAVLEQHHYSGRDVENLVQAVQEVLMKGIVDSKYFTKVSSPIMMKAPILRILIAFRYYFKGNNIGNLVQSTSRAARMLLTMTF